MQTLQFTKRTTSGKNGPLKQEGKIPAVFYGPKEETTSITIKEIDFKKVWREAGESSIIVLKGDAEEHEALIQDVDTHPVSGAPRHADFYVIEKGKKLQINVPLEFTGTSEAVKSLGGILVKVLHELEIEAMPKDLPHDLTVDISALATIDSQILAQDIKLPAGVTLITGPEDVVAAIDVAKEEVEEVPTDISTIELAKPKGKEDEEGAEGGDSPSQE
ncbi:50S ribosomal protein L25 [Patescibacteria group bacterium]|nr:50S ribosomal protein L25 [Patescibacteria group bacterium]